MRGKAMRGLVWSSGHSGGGHWSGGAQGSSISRVLGSELKLSMAQSQPVSRWWFGTFSFFKVIKGY